MIVTTVTVYVKPGFIDQFIQATLDNHEASVKEPDNMRFDILQLADDPARFLLYEAYESEEASRAHKQTTHYLRWRETVAEWMAKPREGLPYHVIAPKKREEW